MFHDPEVPAGFQDADIETAELVQRGNALAAKRYLGDAVYAENVNGMVKLTTEDGISATNTIYLEPEVVTALFDFVKGPVL